VLFVTDIAVGLKKNFAQWVLIYIYTGILLQGDKWGVIVKWVKVDMESVCVMVVLMLLG
jgi:hypothetical protein